MNYVYDLLKKKLAKERIKEGLLSDYLAGSGMSSKDRDTIKHADERKYKARKRIAQLESAIEHIGALL